MNNETASKRIDAIAEEAAEWLVVLEEAHTQTNTPPGTQTNTQTNARFVEWLKTSPEHVKEFLAVAAIWDALPELATQESIDELLAQAAREANVIALSNSPSRPSVALPPVSLASVSLGPSAKSKGGIVGVIRFMAVAATLAAVFVGVTLTVQPPVVDPNLYTTATGEQSSLPLPDGSLVTLNTQSRLRVEYSEGFRNIYLTAGEALFDVAKDPDRPFRVITEQAVIQAVGTQFNVLHAADDVTVTVIEGIVDVTATGRSGIGQSDTSDPLIHTTDQGRKPRSLHGSSLPTPATTQLTVGQQAVVQAYSVEVAVVEAEVEKALAWQQRRLIFEALSLAEVIDEFNRYNTTPLLIEDSGLEKLPISGVFRANDRESFVQFLSQMGLAESYRREDGTIVLRKSAEREISELEIGED